MLEHGSGSGPQCSPLLVRFKYMSGLGRWDGHDSRRPRAARCRVPRQAPTLALLTQSRLTRTYPLGPRLAQSPVPPALVRPKYPPQPAAALGSCWRWRWRGRLRCRGCGRCCSPSSPSRPASTFLPAVMHYAVMTRLSETNSLLLPHSGGAS